MYNDAALFLILAAADDALYSYKSIADAMEQEIPPESDFVDLEYNNDALDKFVLRKCTWAEEITEEWMPKSAFLHIFKASLRNESYAWYVHSCYKIQARQGS